MNIGIIGTGNMGSGLGKLWAGKGHRLMFGSRSAEDKQALASSIGADVRVGTIAEAAAFGEAILFAVPWAAMDETITAMGPLDGKIIIDCTNPFTPDYMSLMVGQTGSGAEEIAKRATGARVVKAFNHVYAQILHSSAQFGSQNASVFLCGDDASAKETVAGLSREIGFDPVDAGPLANARYLEPMAGVMVQLAYALGMGTDQALKLIKR